MKILFLFFLGTQKKKLIQKEEDQKIKYCKKKEEQEVYKTFNLIEKKKKDILSVEKRERRINFSIVW
jgi:hypothetical protein